MHMWPYASTVTLPQYATMANHRPPDEANAELGWDPDFGEPGQPFLCLLRDVAAGEEITADYGPWYTYQRHGFSRHHRDPESHLLT